MRTFLTIVAIVALAGIASAQMPPPVVKTWQMELAAAVKKPHVTAPCIIWLTNTAPFTNYMSKQVFHPNFYGGMTGLCDLLYSTNSVTWTPKAVIDMRLKPIPVLLNDCESSPKGNYRLRQM